MTGAILAGGLSRRMGTDKALLEVGGHRVIDRTVHLFQEIFSQVLIITPNPVNYAYLGVRMAADLFPGRGALGGLHAAIFYATTPHVFVAACDMPMLHRGLIEHLIQQPTRWDIIVPQIGQNLEPLHARYARACLKTIEGALLRGGHRIKDFYRKMRVKYVPEEELRSLDSELLSFRNINTPEDLDAFQKDLTSRAN
jgi:molybdopterin-guanine dinucleotide biosynthesis protein A